jgi:hypothetical protein
VSEQIVRAFRWKTNAAMINEAVRPLGYVTGRTLDATYGEKAGFWKLWRPDELTTNDMNAEAAEHHHDFRWLPWHDHEFETVVYDPPYKLCLDDETEILTRRGWLTCDTLRVGDLAYSMNPESRLGEWRTVTAVHVYNAGLTDVVVFSGRSLDAVATPGHRWRVRSGKGAWKWKRTDKLAAGDRVPLAAGWAETPIEAVYDDAFVELVAWFWTEGTVERATAYGHICQSRIVNPGYCEQIAAAFTKCYGPPVEFFERRGRVSEAAWRIRREERNSRFVFSATIGRELLACAPDKVPSLDFLVALTAEQRELFIRTSFAADGQSDRVIAQSDARRTEGFALALILDGRSVRFGDDQNGRVVRSRKALTARPRRVEITNERRVCRVWCPTVAENETWLARRRGRVYFTGNSGTPAMGDMDNRFGTAEEHGKLNRDGKLAMIAAGAAECWRVTGRRLLVKVMDQVEGGQMRWETDLVTDVLREAGARKLDRFDYLKTPMAQPPRKCKTCRGEGQCDVPGCVDGKVPMAQQHAAANYSTLLVFVRSGRRP